MNHERDAGIIHANIRELELEHFLLIQSHIQHEMGLTLGHESTHT